jgi:protein phosphatase
VAHIGDSRAYLLRDGELRQVTHDHTFVQQLVDEGRITPDQATIHPARSMILRALQGDSDPEPDLDRIEVRAGDRFLICSDGLSGVVRDETMRDALVRHTGLREAAEALVQLAMRGGAPDNVTCVVADVIETESMPAADDTAEAFLVGAASAEQGPRSEPHGRRGPGAAMRSLLRSSERSGHVDDADASEQLRYAPRPPRRFRWLRRLAIIAVIAAVAWGGLVLADNYVRGQYYVGDQAGEVAIFRGVSQDIGPVRLYNVHEIAPGLPVGALPELFRDQVTDTIPASDLPKAEEIVERLRGEACAVHEPTARPSPSPVTTTPPVTPPAAAAPPAATTPSPLPTAPPGYPGLDCAELR